MSADEKYALRGQFAKECIQHNLPIEYIITASPVTKMNNIQKVREILDSEYIRETFKTAYDLKTRSIQFYCTSEDAKYFAKDNKVGVTLGEIQTMSSDTSSLYHSNDVYRRDLVKQLIAEEIFLNYDSHYV